jgi:hypothetical protein
MIWHIPDNDYWGICLFHVVWTIFFGAIILMWYTRNIFLLASDIFFINWTVRMSDNLPERVQILGHVHIICITVRENRIICCQIFCDLPLKSVFERIFNVMQLILFKIKWHIKWNIKNRNVLSVLSALLWLKMSSNFNCSYMVIDSSTTVLGFSVKK